MARMSKAKRPGSKKRMIPKHLDGHPLVSSYEGKPQLEGQSQVKEGKAAYFLGSRPDMNPYTKALKAGGPVDFWTGEVKHPWSANDASGLRYSSGQWDSGYAIAQRRAGQHFSAS